MTPLHPFEDWQLSAHAAGDLEPAEAARVDAHLAACPACRGKAAELELLALGLRSLPPLPPPRDIWEAIEARLPAQAPAPVMAISGSGAGPRHPFEDWQLSAQLSGDLEPLEAAAIEAHVAACAACRARREELRLMVSALGALPALEPSPFLWARVRAGLHTRPHRAPSVSFARWVPAGLAAAAALAVVLVSHPGRHEPPAGRVAGTLASHRAGASQGVAGPNRASALGSTAAGAPQGVAPGATPGSTPSAQSSKTPAPALTPSTSPQGPSGESQLAARSELQSPSVGASRRLRGRASAQLASAQAGAPTGGVDADAQDLGSAGGPEPDPTLTASIRAHLDELDASINETQRNLALNPGNERVQAAAWAAYMAKVEYLRSILGRSGSGAMNSRNKSSELLPPTGRQPARDAA